MQERGLHVPNKQKDYQYEYHGRKAQKTLTLAMLKDGNLENAFERTSSFTSLPRSPQNKR